MAASETYETKRESLELAWLVGWFTGLTSHGGLA